MSGDEDYHKVHTESSDQPTIGDLYLLGWVGRNSVKRISDRVDCLSETVHSRQRPAESRSSLWVDRVQGFLCPEGPDTIILLEDKKSCRSCQTPSVEGLELPSRYLKHIDHDSSKRHLSRSEAKTNDAELAKLQALVLDPVVHGLMVFKHMLLYQKFIGQCFFTHLSFMPQKRCKICKTGYWQSNLFGATKMKASSTSPQVRGGRPAATQKGGGQVYRGGRQWRNLPPATS